MKGLKDIIGTKYIPQIDFEYLSLKYRNTEANFEEERDRVFYKFFYKDFEKLEEHRLIDKIDGLTPQDLDELRKNLANKENPLAFKIPQKFIDFYKDIKNIFIDGRQE